jgi:quercetin dioxygenase-like cupin family protein
MNNPTIKPSSEHFVVASEQVTEDMGDGIKRTIMGFEPSLMLARNEFEKGSVGYVHEHHHVQLAYVESGAFDFTIGEETRRLAAGDCAYIPSAVPHGAICVEKGVLLDIFSPMREDFLEGEDA